MEEVVKLRRLGFRFIALADDNFYPVTLTDLELVQQQNNVERLNELKAIRGERLELMARLAQLPTDKFCLQRSPWKRAKILNF